MSADTEGRDKACCASCGIAEDDNIKLKDCSACHLVRYCGVECQRKHRPQHKKECKKRATELRDEILFKQPETNHHGDCPICCLPLSLDPKNSVMMPCCSKIICDGCDYANQISEFKRSLPQKCPFCRHPTPSEEEFKKNLTKRAEANDPTAIYRVGKMRYRDGDYEAAFEYYKKAAGLGHVAAHYELSVMYQFEQGVVKDEKMQLYHSEQAAIGGHPTARHNLGCNEMSIGMTDRAVKHWIIAAKLGQDHSLENVKRAYREGLVSKEDLASALRAHQAAIDDTKSPHRDEAKTAPWSMVFYG